MTQASPSGVAAPLALLVGDAPVRLWGLTARERLQRQLARQHLTVLASADDPARGAPAVIVFDAGFVYDEPLITALVKAPTGVLLRDESGRPAATKVDPAHAGIAAEALARGESPSMARDTRTPETLAGNYNHKLRKREVPYLLPLSADTLDPIERRMFMGSYKGVTDVVTKYFWPTPARHVTRWCAAAGITPNQVTFTSLALVFVSFYCFWIGAYLPGLVSGWIMTFLDTVDGKLARVTMNSSKVGDVFDHGIDLIHPPFWWWAWIVGLPAAGVPLASAQPVLWVILAGYVLQRIQEGIFSHRFGIHMHAWRPFDSFFRLITARRNPNLLLLTPAALLGRPDWGIVAVAIWVLISLAVHTVQIVQGFAASRRGPIESWLSR